MRSGASALSEDVRDSLGFGPEKTEAKAAGTEAFEPDDTTVADCSESELPCLEQAFGNLAYKKGAKAALGEIAAHQGRADMIDRQCHRLRLG